jgi:hypothetical protein
MMRKEVSLNSHKIPMGRLNQFVAFEKNWSGALFLGSFTVRYKIEEGERGRCLIQP